jgi:hypothetical protein
MCAHRAAGIIRIVQFSCEQRYFGSSQGFLVGIDLHTSMGTYEYAFKARAIKNEAKSKSGPRYRGRRAIAIQAAGKQRARINGTSGKDGRKISREYREEVFTPGDGLDFLHR